jgi:hypothetical protein
MCLADNDSSRNYASKISRYVEMYATLKRSSGFSFGSQKCACKRYANRVVASEEV